MGRVGATQMPTTQSGPECHSRQGARTGRARVPTYQDAGAYANVVASDSPVIAGPLSWLHFLDLSEDPTMPRTAYSALAAVTLLAQLAALATGQQAPPTAAEAAAIPVQVESVRTGPIRSELLLTGTIEARAEASIFADMPGRIAEVRVDEGDTVGRGDVLAVLHHVTNLGLAVRQAEIQLQAAEIRLGSARTMAEVTVAAQLQQARSALATARAGLQDVEYLSEVRVVSQIEQAEAGLESLRANMKKIREGAREQERAQVESTLDQAQANLDNADADFERMRELYESGVIARQTFDGAEARNKVAQAQFDIARQQRSLIEEGARAEDIEAVSAQVRQAEAGLGVLRTMADTKSWERDIARATANVAQAEAMLAVAETAWDTQGWLVEIGLAETQYQSAEVALAMAKRKLEDAYVKAPFDGTISGRFVDVGDHAISAMPQAVGIFDIVDMDVVHASVSASETNLRDLKLGQAASVSTRFQEDPVSGLVDLIAPSLDPGTHTATIEIVVDNAGHTIKPGAFVQARVIVQSIPDAVLASRTALVNLREGRADVYVVENGRARAKAVEIGITNGAIVQIASGLNDGDAVVIAGQPQLSDNALVRVVSAD